jgi:hypothetical protein
LGDVSTSTAPSLRCPRCSATLRAGTEWCSLCYADLRPREESAPAPANLDVRPASPKDAASPVERQPVPPVESPAGPQPSRRGGKHAKQPEFGAVTAPTDEVERLADQLLAELAATEGGSPLGAASGLVDSSGKRVALMVGGGLGILLLLFVLMAVAGALL